MMMAVLLLLLVIPFSLAIGTIMENADELVNWSKFLVNFTLPPPPDWLERLPLVGSPLAEGWRRITAAGAIPELSSRLSPHAGKLTRWFLAQAGNFGMMFLHFLLTLLISAILYAKGEAAAAGIIRFARRIAGAHGESSVRLAGMAIRAVALGVIVTALIQSALAGLGLAVVGMPFAALLTALCFVFCIAQIGPAPVLIPAVIWVYWQGDPGWASALLVWSILVCTIDNFLRPVLIRTGGAVSMLLILTGVIGGLVAFGIIGLFIGPVVLAVTYTLLAAWVREDEPEELLPAAQPAGEP
jgi:predicted PurR-regulated permease PerM